MANESLAVETSSSGAPPDSPALTPNPVEAKVDSQPEHWDLIMRPRAGWFDWRLRELWEHRDLLRLLVWRDFVTLHKQTILGPLWHIINPLITALTFSLVFGRVVKLPTDGVPPFLFYMAGTVAWNYFTACIFKTTNSLAGNAGLFGKVYFHRFVVPLSAVISSLIAFGIQCAMLGIMVGIDMLRGATIHPNLWLLCFPLLVAMLAGYGLSIGLICSALTTRYRDLAQLVGFSVQIMMFATPIIYPVSFVNPNYRWVVDCNPLAAIIETFRFAWLGQGAPEPLSLLYSALILVALFIVGLTLFTRVERTFMDTV
ncbi:MAG TPA: ABC transporter permease [Verrucomicrobiae bacterium]|jgi:lipopolysaccharide transport system permease protein